MSVGAPDVDQEHLSILFYLSNIPVKQTFKQNHEPSWNVLFFLGSFTHSNPTLTGQIHSKCSAASAYIMIMV